MNNRTQVFPFRAGPRSRVSRADAEDAAQQAAYESQLQPCWDPLWRYAYHTCENAEDASDLLSETVMEGYKSFKQFRGETTFLRWMYRVMTTTRIDMYRKNLRHRNQSLDAWCDEGGDRLEMADAGANPEDIIIGREFSEPVQLAMAMLPEEYRIVVVLADIEQLDYAEVSQILQIPMGTVRSRIHRARNLLRKALAAQVGPDVRNRRKYGSADD